MGRGGRGRGGKERGDGEGRVRERKEEGRERVRKEKEGGRKEKNTYMYRAKGIVKGKEGVVYTMRTCNIFTMGNVQLNSDNFRHTTDLSFNSLAV